MSAYPQVPLGEICAINPRGQRTKDSTEDMVVSFVPMAAVDEQLGAIAVREERPLTDVSKGFTAFEDGDVLFAKITPCMENGKVALARNLTNSIGRGSTEFYVLRPGDRVLSEYIYHFVRQPRFREAAKRNFTGTAGQQRVPKSFMENALVPLPPLAEQRRIADILNRAARIERLRARAADRLREFVPALFIKMFGDPVENPIRWPVVRLGDVAGQGQYGLNAPAITHADSIRFIRITDIDDNGDLIKNRRVFVDPKIANLDKYELVPDDILIARSGATSGKSYLHRDIGERSVFAGYLIRFRIVDKIKLLPLYLFNFLHTREYWRQIRAKKRVAAQPNVNAKELASISFPLPPINEQKQFVGIIDHVLRINAIYQGTSISPSLLTASLMDRLLGGNPTS